MGAHRASPADAKIVHLDGEMVELTLLLSPDDLSAVEESARWHKLTTAQFLRGAIAERIAHRFVRADWDSSDRNMDHDKNER